MIHQKSLKYAFFKKHFLLLSMSKTVIFNKYL